jgi:hypothetical protein
VRLFAKPEIPSLRSAVVYFWSQKAYLHLYKLRLNLPW